MATTTATATATTTATADMPPNHTLYVNNLNDKIKADRMKATLYATLSQHGKILEIVMGRARRLRGQAWVTFDDIASASNALRATNGAMLFEKPAVIAFAKDKADVIARREGTFVPREKRPREAPAAQAPVAKKPTDAKAVATGAGASAAGATAAGGSGSSSVLLPPPPPSQNVPNKILFLQELPEVCTQEMLSVLFKQYQGFTEVRMVPGKKGLAFVEFGDEAQAAIALQGLFGFKLTPTDTLRVSFAKR
ncbi:unnamed protein product [Hyaloperonospora brassicae]|uniref:RRM domain-containing protein n=1 Tax=Hyaloperonospora brassicae TaxID=162125 RepID=A0AAV0U8L4_HYABA|nr:unnamed protein product [Hyaloperonospora brassicae]